MKAKIDISKDQTEKAKIHDFLSEGREFFKKADYSKAAECFTKALSTVERMNSKDLNYEASEVHRNLASAYMMRCLYGQAQPHFIRSLEIAELLCSMSLCSKHSSLLTRSVGALATFLLNQGMLAEAEPYCVRCLTLAEKTYGMDHYKLLEPIRAMAFLCEKQNRIDDSIRHLKRAYIVVVYTRGPVHTEAQKLIDDLLRLLHSIGDLHTAEAYALLNLENLKDFSNDQESLLLAEAYIKLAKLNLESENPKKAESRLLCALEIQQTVLGCNHSDVGETIYMLATSLFKQEKVDSETEMYYKRALEIFELVYGNESPQVAGMLRDIGVLHLCRGEADMAEDFISLCAGMQRRMLGSSHEQLAATLDILATIFYNQKRFLEAQMLWMKAEVILVKKYGPSHSRCVQIKEDLKDVRQYLN
mmetsp:Transcript_8357/g.8520  ORF Transcript_8357/g.8520 Transcript_8357/m.8520 type:complete len:418 (-) Transcript_8357:307-1560(-)|eukprot:CAMPEP_0182422868 /NCGR_PEP_ID=MMETSP1167-20130531/8684_1 /TAXON_ID=2988 /ORGANISM="Mallomonas Sp, Strain CCMP3275" /LENGTH=417 /DNA_ID=CAMNT_0024601303 /DNA_START=261 /DNA_END=1514 /DNA_ORIENTATION=+